MYSDIQEVRLPDGRWVLVETLGGIYPSRDKAREAKSEMEVSRKMNDEKHWNLYEQLMVLFNRVFGDNQVALDQIE
jgi:hypothetical protein